jgi:hypothetical protein
VVRSVRLVSASAYSDALFGEKRWDRREQVMTPSRLSPVVDPRFSYRGENVVATLEQACRKIGYPRQLG